MGRACRIMAEKDAAAAAGGNMASSGGDIKLQKGYSAKEELRKNLKAKSTSAEDNAKAADKLKLQLLSNGSMEDPAVACEKNNAASKRKASEISANLEDEIDMVGAGNDNDGAFVVDDFVVDDDDDDEMNDCDEDKAAMDEAKKNIKEKIKDIETAKLDDFAKNVMDNVRLHEPGWKVSANPFATECCTLFVVLQQPIHASYLCTNNP
jgi:hypothetical protein